MPHNDLPGTPNLEAILGRARITPKTKWQDWLDKYVLVKDWKYWLAIIPVILLVLVASFIVLALAIYYWQQMLLLLFLIGLIIWFITGVNYLTTRGY